MKALRKPLSLFMAMLMCLGIFAGTGTTAFAAGETMTTYMVEFPRASDPNKAGWGHSAMNFLGGWSTGENNGFTIHTQDSFNGKVIYCIEPGVGVHSGDQFTGRGEDFWDDYPSDLNPTIPPDTIKEYIGRIMTYGWQGNASTSWMTDDPEDASKMAGAIATQLLVWETVVGERDSQFNHVDANAQGKNNIAEYISPENPIYNEIFSQYSAIESAVKRHTMLPSFFSSTADAGAYELKWDGQQYSLTLTDSEWIVSVGRHEGFISSRKWVETQNMLDEIAEKYNRPHRKTNALLSGLMYCPICGKRLRVLPESNRWTNGKPRFKYACPGVRAKECTFKGVEGVTLDEFVIHSLSSLQEEHSDYYRQLLENRVASMIRTDQSEKEYQETQKAIERLNADIAAQVRNLREADDALKRFIQDDIKELTDELAKREATLRRMEDTQSENQYLVHELNGMKKRLLSFEEFAKDAQPEALFTLVHSIVDRIYITTDGTKQKCQVYIKGCATENYSDILGAAGYIEEEPLLPVVSYMPPMCDLDYYSIKNNLIFITC